MRGEHDDGSYIDPQLKGGGVGRDCLKVSEEFIQREAWADKAVLAAWRAEAMSTVEEAVVKVQHESGPDPFKETWCALSARHLCEAQI